MKRPKSIYMASTLDTLHETEECLSIYFLSSGHSWPRNEYPLNSHVPTRADVISVKSPSQQKVSHISQDPAAVWGFLFTQTRNPKILAFTIN
jgi:hypothetical protein